MLDKFIIYTKTVDFIIWLFPAINTFPKSQRFVLGQEIEKIALEILKQIVTANHQTIPIERQKILIQLDTDLQVLRALLRVAYVLKFLNNKQYEYTLEKVGELGKILGGWVKQTALAAG